MKEQRIASTSTLEEHYWVDFTSCQFMHLSSNQRYALKKKRRLGRDDHVGLSLIQVRVSVSHHGEAHHLDVNLKTRAVKYRVRDNLTAMYKKRRLEEMSYLIKTLLESQITRLYAELH